MNYSKTLGTFFFLLSSFVFVLPVIAQENSDLAAEEIQEQTTNTSETTPTYNIDNIDESRIQQARLQRVNEERNNLGAEPLTLDNKLISTSILRAEDLASKNKFSNMHQRPGCKGSRCTDLIKQRFENNDITANVNESIGRGSYRCNKDNCTDDFIAATKKRFDSLFMGEKKSNGVHYKMMVSKNYTKVGFGFALAQHPKRGQQYILVMHVSN